MDLETIPRVAAVLLAGVCALTDWARHKIYHKVLLAGLAVWAIWMPAFALWHHLGAEDSIRAFPELGTWWWEDPAPPPRPPDQAPSPFDRGRQESLWDRQDDGSRPGDTPEARTEQASPRLLPWLARVLANGALAFLVGFGLWWGGLWAAGDAKLFAVLVLLIPLSTYRNAFWPFFPGYVLLFNTFFSVMALLAVELVARGIRQAVRPTPDEADAWRDAWRWLRGHVQELAIGFVGILFLFLAIKTLRGLTRDLLTEITPLRSGTLIYFLLFLIFTPLTRWMRRWYVGIPVGVAVTAYIVHAVIWPTDQHNLRSILTMSGWAVGVILFLVIYRLYLAVFDFRSIGIWQLEARMIPAQRTLEVLKEDMDLVREKMGPVGPDGLTAVQAEVLRRWWIDKGKGGRIHVAKTFPFAPALFVGTVLTVWFGGYLVRV